MTDTTARGDLPPDHGAPPTPAQPAAGGRRLGRRAFLGVTLAGGALATFAAAGDWFRVRTRALWHARAVENYARAYTYAHLPPAERIMRHFDYLTLERADVDRFVADYERVYGEVELRALAANRLLYTKFLMSTNFFPNGADERLPVRYVTLHDPYTSPCWNPFAPRA